MVLLPALILDAFYSGTMPRGDQARQCLPPTKCLFLTPLRAEAEYRALLVKAGLRRDKPKLLQPGDLKSVGYQIRQLMSCPDLRREGVDHPDGADCHAAEKDGVNPVDVNQGRVLSCF
jgi:hypothetical protein